MKAIEMVMEVELLEGRAPRWTRFPASERCTAMATASWDRPTVETMIKVVEMIDSEGANCPHVDIRAFKTAPRTITIFTELEDAPDDARVVG